MKKEDKELLFKDLCARLPYHVRCKIWLKDGTIEEGLLDLQHNYGNVLQDAFYYNKIKNIKPYLRPMSSITEEEKKELNEVTVINYNEFEGCSTLFDEKGFDWLNAHHFDYRGLIPIDLAIAVTKENNPYKEY